MIHSRAEYYFVLTRFKNDVIISPENYLDEPIWQIRYKSGIGFNRLKGYDKTSSLTSCAIPIQDKNLIYLIKKGNIKNE